jgi:collagen beta-1,O-galactosyltransferase
MYIDTKCLLCVGMNCCSYLGRKILRSMDEALVEDASMLVWPHYSYWTISYMLSYRGAWKLVQQNPLTKLVPVDEYLPIMFDAHPV